MAAFGQGDNDFDTDETFDFVCTMCKKKNRNTEADKFCADCQDYYCNTCVKVHDDVPVLQAHKTLDKSQIKPGTSASFPVVCTERCNEHGHMAVNMYCREHDVVGCLTCMVVKHSECREKYYVPDYITKTKRPDARAEKVKLDEISKNLDVLKEEFMKEKKRIIDNNDTVLEMIHDFRDEINHCLDELEQNTIQQVEQKFQALIGQMEAKLREVQVLTNEVKTALDNLQSAGGNLSEMFVRSKLAHEVISKAERIISLSTSNKSITADVTFQGNKKLSLLLNEINTLGILNKRKDTKREPKIKPDPDQSPSILALNKNCISVRVKSDKKTCSIISACVLDDGTIIIADNINSNLKRLDRPKYNVKDTCDLSLSPMQVCVTGQQEVAVACGFSKTVQFVAVRDSMSKTRQVSTDFSCCGLAYADGKLYISDYYTAVYVYTLSWKKLQQFHKDLTGCKLFSDIRSLAVNSDISRIYVADSKKGLLILDMSGKLVGQFSGDELQWACGVCLYKNGRVLVTGLNSKHVLQFSAEGKLIGSIIKSDGWSQAICCDSNYNNLLIGFLDKDEIEFYDLG